MNDDSTVRTDREDTGPERKITLFGRSFSLPKSRMWRIILGVGLVIMGIFGFLPVLGFWMIPLGLLVLSYEFAVIRRLRRKLIVRNGKRTKKNRAPN